MKANLKQLEEIQKELFKQQCDLDIQKAMVKHFIKKKKSEQLTLTDVVGRSEQLKALEDLKDFAYDNCQPHNSDRLSEIMERL